MGGRGGRGTGVWGRGEGRRGAVVGRTTEYNSIKLSFYFSYFLKYIFLSGGGVGRRDKESLNMFQSIKSFIFNIF